MLRVVKHIALVALCLLVVGGAAGMRVYVFGCAKSHHVARISMSGEDKCCCRSHNACSHEQDAAVAAIDASCCTTDSQLLSVSSFEVSQATKFHKVAVAATLFDMCCTCNGECCHAPGAALAASIVHSPPPPNLHSFGQLRL
jgi:hypothetical protein